MDTCPNKNDGEIIITRHLFILEPWPRNLDLESTKKTQLSGHVA